jgi:hypothetical protein
MRTTRDSNEDKLTEVYHRYACRNMAEDRKVRMEAQTKAHKAWEAKNHA